MRGELCLLFLRITDVWQTSVFSCLFFKSEKKPVIAFLTPRRARFSETTPRSHQTFHRRVPQPREKPASSKTPLHAATKLPTCQPLWQPLLAHLQAHASEEATTALLTSFAHRSAVACRAVTTAKPPAGPSHNHDHAGLAPSPALRPRTSPHHAADALAPAIDPPKRR